MPQSDSQAARHTRGWIVLGGLFLLACLVFKMPRQTSSTLDLYATIELGIDVNRASEAELACIPGVGASLARRIVNFREQYGPFVSLSQLEQVPGVGPAKVAQLAEALLPLEEKPARLAASPQPPVNAQMKPLVTTPFDSPLRPSTGSLHD